MSVGGVGPGGSGDDWNRNEDWDEEPEKQVDDEKESNATINSDSTSKTENSESTNKTESIPQHETVINNVNNLASNRLENLNNNIPGVSTPASLETLKQKLVVLKNNQSLDKKAQLEDVEAQITDREAQIRDREALITDRVAQLESKKSQIHDSKTKVVKSTEEVKTHQTRIGVTTEKTFSVEEKQKREASVKQYVFLERMPNGQFRVSNAEPNNKAHLEKISKGETAQKRDGKFVFMSGLAKDIENAPETISIIHPDGSVTEHLKSEIFVAATKEEEEASKETVRAYQDILELEQQHIAKQEAALKKEQNLEENHETPKSTPQPKADHALESTKKWLERRSDEAKQEVATQNLSAQRKENIQKERAALRHTHEIREIRVSGKRKRDQESDAARRVQNEKELNRSRINLENEQKIIHDLPLPPIKPEESFQVQHLSRQVQMVYQNGIENSISEANLSRGHLILQQQAESQEIVSKSINNINQLSNTYMLNANNLEKITNMLVPNIDNFDNSVGEIIIQTTLTVLEKAQNGEQPYAKEIALINQWKMIVALFAK